VLQFGYEAFGWKDTDGVNDHRSGFLLLKMLHRTLPMDGVKVRPNRLTKFW
jgi:hypothetical protein